MKSKYIIISTSDRDIPIVFPLYVTHLSMSESLKSKLGVVTSAGFCYIGSDGIYHCSGRSESLNIDSNANEDSYILNTILL